MWLPLSLKHCWASSCPNSNTVPVFSPQSPKAALNQRRLLRNVVSNHTTRDKRSMFFNAWTTWWRKKLFLPCIVFVPLFRFLLRDTVPGMLIIEGWIRMAWMAEVVKWLSRVWADPSLPLLLSVLRHLPIHISRSGQTPADVCLSVLDPLMMSLKLIGVSQAWRGASK